MSRDILEITVAEARLLAMQACLGCGAGVQMARSLVEATLSAETEGKSGLGFPHFADYLTAMKEGRINPQAVPEITSPLAAIIHCDAMDGIAQHGFDLAIAQLKETAATLGVSIFTLRNSFSAGEIGYYVRRLAKDGFMALAFANAHALMAPSAGAQKTFSTNPLAFGVPLGAGVAPLVFDQASSATAYVNILSAAAKGETIPEGWATDAEGNATIDPAKAAAGALLPAGGYKGANIALMVEMLAAGFTAAEWSLEAGAFNIGSKPPRTGMTIVVFKPDAIDPHFSQRCAAQLERLAGLGLRRPGNRSATAVNQKDRINIPVQILAQLQAYANAAPSPQLAND